MKNTDASFIAIKNQGVLEPELFDPQNEVSNRIWDLATSKQVMFHEVEGLQPLGKRLSHMLVPGSRCKQVEDFLDLVLYY